MIKENQAGPFYGPPSLRPGGMKILNIGTVGGLSAEEKPEGSVDLQLLTVIDVHQDRSFSIFDNDRIM